MATVTVRILDATVVKRLKVGTAANKRSLEAERRDVLTTVAIGSRAFDLRRMRIASRQ